MTTMLLLFLGDLGVLIADVVPIVFLGDFGDEGVLIEEFLMGDVGLGDIGLAIIEFAPNLLNLLVDVFFEDLVTTLDLEVIFLLVFEFVGNEVPTAAAAAAVAVAVGL
mmetsp:Transcript_1601/g.2163  ORF Transcript_1601/g.2163 Transcript_1601/m.2163 type:complete len:108 (-) Transcript_1601:705-1028(-)